jgi:hypothetical protein
MLVLTEATMLTAHVVVETQPGKARRVADMIGQLQGMSLLHVEGDDRIVASWNVPDGQNPEPEGVSDVLRAMSPEILGVALVDEEERASPI